ncbi:MAG: septal ring lytic transglycosylase RlpA family protein [Azonexus sp.]|jgi:rare lipoprotein A|uniref:septal ring lytic transglycosylase RlpA family protein n=1 Tax=Azonexus sp. TaxID=1872668 RepID=UPI002835C7B4|nr:septal ring lytic transglycosylase RlpA family protein [Azonexus sp.]MDR0777177.1 septal ring lytic transglycosylase RlpA family protein [Azonexus sp.]
MRPLSRLLVLLLPALLLAACGTSTHRSPSGGGTEASTPSSRTPTSKPTVTLKRGGGFYKDDGPGDEIPDGLDDIPNAEPKWEPLHRPATRPYVVLGKEYVPNTAVKPHKERGVASWYGKKFHGQKTSNGDIYDMFGMTAAHPTLALPSYVRVTSLNTGNAVIVRVNDRGPFHAGRVIDLSYTAAYKLGLITGGSGLVEVEAILPGEPTGITYAQVAPPASGDDEIARLALRDEAPVAANGDDNRPGIYLQLGAFANPDNAENLRNHLTRELDWLTETMVIRPGSGIHRLQLGPYASRGDAEQVAEKIRATLGQRPTIVTR